MWVHNAVYSLTMIRKLFCHRLVGSMTASSQQHRSSYYSISLTSGLQPPTLQQAWGSDVHRGEFVQIHHVHNSHWCVVSNECEDGTVDYYDSMYPSVPSQTMQLIATLMFNPASELKVRIMDVGQQSKA